MKQEERGGAGNSRFGRMLKYWRLQLANEVWLHANDTSDVHLQEIDSRVWEILRDLLLTRYREDRPAKEGRNILEPLSYNDAPGLERLLADVLGSMRSYSFREFEPSFLGAAYEQYLAYTPVRSRNGSLALKRDIQARKGAGSFYTPPSIIDYILDQTLEELISGKSMEQLEQVKVLDPACGCGAFLLRAFDRLKKQYLQRYGSERGDVRGSEVLQEINRQILGHNLYGLDLDRKAVAVARMALRLSADAGREEEFTSILTDSVKCGNALIDRPPGKHSDVGSHIGGITCTGIPEQREFDLVIGNPPWISFGLRGTGAIDRGMDACLRTLYPNSAEYKISTYALFIDRAISLLQDGGFCGFIVPDSLLLGRYFSKIRSHILQTMSIRRIHLIEEDFWPHGSIGRSVIIILQKEPDPIARRNNRVKVSCSRSLEDLKGGAQRTHAYMQQYFEDLPHHRFRLFFDQQSMDLVSHMEEGAILLRDIVSIHTGVRSRIGQKKVIGEEQKGPNWKPGIVSGREVGRYRLSYGGHYINIDPALLWSGGWDPEVVLQEKLIMRQTGDRLIATFDGTGLYHLNNCHSIAPKDKNYHLKYILAILNSRLMNQYYRLISLEQGRALAQIDIEMIGFLPIRYSPPEDQRQIVALVDELIACILACDTFTSVQEAPAALLARVHALEASIDEKVFGLYGIDGAEMMGVCG